MPEKSATSAAETMSEQEEPASKPSFEGPFPELATEEYYLNLGSEVDADVAVLNLFLEAQQAFQSGDIIGGLITLREGVEAYPNAEALYVPLFQMYQDLLPAVMNQPRSRLWQDAYKSYELAAENLTDPEIRAEVADIGIKTSYLYLDAGAAPRQVVGLHEALLKLGANEMDVRMNLGSVLLELGRTDEALTQFNKSLELDPGNIQVVARLFRLYMLEEQYDAALALVESAIEANPDEGDLKRLLALFHTEREEYKKAANIFEEALPNIELNKRARARVEYAFVLEKLERHDEMVRQLTFALADENVAPEAAEMLFLHLVRREDYSRAREILTNTSDNLNERVSNGVHMAYGLMLMELEKWDEAEWVFESIIDNDTPFDEPYRALFQIHLSQDEFEKAATVAERVQEQFPGEATGCVQRSRLMLVRREYKEAADFLEECLDSFPGNIDLLYFRGVSLERVKRFDEAENYLLEVISLDPTHHQALNYLAYSYAEKGVKLEIALEYIERALRLRPESGSYLDTLGWINYKLGEYQEALRWLQAANDRSPNEPEILSHLGDTLYRLGNPEAAMSLWEEALEQVDEETFEEVVQGLEERVASGEIPEATLIEQGSPIGTY